MFDYKLLVLAYIEYWLFGFNNFNVQTKVDHWKWLNKYQFNLQLSYPFISLIYPDTVLPNLVLIRKNKIWFFPIVLPLYIPDIQGGANKTGQILTSKQMNIKSSILTH